MVGLPDTAVKECGYRVFSTLANSAFCIPRARTIGNLTESNAIQLNRLTKAIQYRGLDRTTRA